MKRAAAGGGPFRTAPTERLLVTGRRDRKLRRAAARAADLFELLHLAVLGAGSLGEEEDGPAPSARSSPSCLHPRCIPGSSNPFS